MPASPLVPHDDDDDGVRHASFPSPPQTVQVPLGRHHGKNTAHHRSPSLQSKTYDEWREQKRKNEENRHRRACEKRGEEGPYIPSSSSFLPWHAKVVAGGAAGGTSLNLLHTKRGAPFYVDVPVDGPLAYTPHASKARGKKGRPDCETHPLQSHDIDAEGCPTNTQVMPLQKRSHPIPPPYRKEKETPEGPLGEKKKKEKKKEEEEGERTGRETAHDGIEAGGASPLRNASFPIPTTGEENDMQGKDEHASKASDNPSNVTEKPHPTATAPILPSVDHHLPQEGRDGQGKNLSDRTDDFSIGSVPATEAKSHRERERKGTHSTHHGKQKKNQYGVLHAALPPLRAHTFVEGERRNERREKAMQVIGKKNLRQTKWKQKKHGKGWGKCEKRVAVAGRDHKKAMRWQQTSDGGAGYRDPTTPHRVGDEGRPREGSMERDLEMVRERDVVAASAPFPLSRQPSISSSSSFTSPLWRTSTAAAAVPPFFAGGGRDSGSSSSPVGPYFPTRMNAAAGGAMGDASLLSPAATYRGGLAGKDVEPMDHGVWEADGKKQDGGGMPVAFAARRDAYRQGNMVAMEKDDPRQKMSCWDPEQYAFFFSRVLALMHQVGLMCLVIGFGASIFGCMVFSGSWMVSGGSSMSSFSVSTVKPSVTRDAGEASEGEAAPRLGNATVDLAGDARGMRVVPFSTDASAAMSLLAPYQPFFFLVLTVLCMQCHLLSRLCTFMIQCYGKPDAIWSNRRTTPSGKTTAKRVRQAADAMQRKDASRRATPSSDALLFSSTATKKGVRRDVPWACGAVTSTVDGKKWSASAPAAEERRRSLAQVEHLDAKRNRQTEWRIASPEKNAAARYLSNGKDEWETSARFFSSPPFTSPLMADDAHGPLSTKTKKNHATLWNRWCRPARTDKHEKGKRNGGMWRESEAKMGKESSNRFGTPRTGHERVDVVEDRFKKGNGSHAHPAATTKAIWSERLAAEERQQSKAKRAFAVAQQASSNATTSQTLRETFTFSAFQDVAAQHQRQRVWKQRRKEYLQGMGGTGGESTKSSSSVCSEGSGKSGSGTGGGRRQRAPGGLWNSVSGAPADEEPLDRFGSARLSFSVSPSSRWFSHAFASSPSPAHRRWDTRRDGQLGDEEERSGEDGADGMDGTLQGIMMPGSRSASISHRWNPGMRGVGDREGLGEEPWGGGALHGYGGGTPEAERQRVTLTGREGWKGSTSPSSTKRTSTEGLSSFFLFPPAVLSDSRYPPPCRMDQPVVPYRSPTDRRRLPNGFVLSSSEKSGLQSARRERMQRRGEESVYYDPHPQRHDRKRQEECFGGGPPSTHRMAYSPHWRTTSPSPSPLLYGAGSIPSQRMCQYPHRSSVGGEMPFSTPSPAWSRHASISLASWHPSSSLSHPPFASTSPIAGSKPALPSSRRRVHPHGEDGTGHSDLSFPFPASNMSGEGGGEDEWAMDGGRHRIESEEASACVAPAVTSLPPFPWTTSSFSTPYGSGLAGCGGCMSCLWCTQSESMMHLAHRHPRTFHFLQETIFSPRFVALFFIFFCSAVELAILFHHHLSAIVNDLALWVETNQANGVMEDTPSIPLSTMANASGFLSAVTEDAWTNFVSTSSLKSVRTTVSTSYPVSFLLVVLFIRLALFGFVVMLDMLSPFCAGR